MRSRTWIFAIAGCAVLMLCGLGVVAAGGLGYVWYQQGASVVMADPPLGTPGLVIDLPTPVAAQPTDVIAVPADATPTPTTSALGGYQMQTACDSPYNPVRPGATWTYSTSGTGFGDFKWTLTVDSVTGDLNNATAEVSETFGAGAKYTYQWLCSPAGMQWQATGGTSPNGTLTATVTNYEGQRLLAPALLVPGATWTESYLQVSKTSTGTLNESFSGTYVLNGLQSVTTSLGTFDALTVVSNTTDELTSTGGKTTSQQVNTFYYVSGVGPVRYDVKDNVGNTLSDLVSYTVPK